MTHPAIAALHVARDAELLASDAAAHGDSVTWADASLRAQTILACEVEVDMGRWVRRTSKRTAWRYTSTANLAALTTWGTSVEVSRSPYWGIERSVDTTVLAGETIRAGDALVLDADGNVRPAAPPDFNTLGLLIGDWIHVEDETARVVAIQPTALTLDRPLASGRTSVSPAECREQTRQCGRAFLESLRSHRRHR